MRLATLVLLIASLLAAPGAHARRVVVAIDGSGSLKEAAAAYGVAEALGDFIAKLAPTDELAIITFDDRAALLRAPAPIGTGASVAASQLATLRYDGSHSDLPAALALACDAFPIDALSPVHVLLVTDGVVTVRPPRSAADAVADMKQRILPRCLGASARIHVIGLGGQRADTETLQGLAEASGGRSEFPLSSTRVREFLDRILQATAPHPPPEVAPPANAAASKAPASATQPATAPATPPARRATWPLWIAALLGGIALVALALLLAARRRREAETSLGGTGFVEVREAATGKDHSLRLPATIGRSPSSPILLEDKEASRRHFRLEAHEGKVAVVDLGSANGTFVNGVRLRENEPRVVRPGDRLKIPGLELILQPPAMDADATYIRQDLDGTMIRPAEPQERVRRSS